MNRELAKVLGIVGEQLGHRLVKIREAPLPIDDKDPVGGVLNVRAELRLTLLEGRIVSSQAHGGVTKDASKIRQFVMADNRHLRREISPGQRLRGVVELGKRCGDGSGDDDAQKPCSNEGEQYCQRED